MLTSLPSLRCFIIKRYSKRLKDLMLFGFDGQADQDDTVSLSDKVIVVIADTQIT